jgi:hypothetical protein
LCSSPVSQGSRPWPSIAPINISPTSAANNVYVIKITYSHVLIINIRRFTK